MLKNIISFLILVSFSAAFADVNVVPLPNYVQISDTNAFNIDSNTTIVASDKLAAITKQLDGYLSPALGYHLAVKKNVHPNSICLGIVDDNELGDEGYCLEVKTNGVSITANTSAGLFHGIQTLRQLLPYYIFSRDKISDVKWEIPCLVIRDVPQFRWRGMHLDVSRHFMSVEFVKKYIDLLAIHKMNRFHWHLTDDQGWRIEIKKYPKLTSVGAWRDKSQISPQRQPLVYENKHYGGYYTQEQIRDVVQYAKERFIEVVPEIEMPGHCAASVAAYPELSCRGEEGSVMTKWGSTLDVYCPGKEEVFNFNQNVLAEVMQLFPYEYIHIGGDEVRKNRWRECPLCHARMKQESLQDVNELQSYFIKRIEKFLTTNNRKLIGWDEILEGGLAPEATMMCWRDAKYAVEAVRQGHDVVMSPTSHCYFDYYQGDKAIEPLAFDRFLPLSKVYDYNPVPAELTAEQVRHVLGVQANLWTEFVPTQKQAEYMAYPRGCALSEVGWTQPEKKNYDNFLLRLHEHLKRLDSYDWNYRRLYN